MIAKHLLTPEMHEVIPVNVNIFENHGCKIKGIIHVGANVGQEIPAYIERLHLPIIAFEPHPEAFAELHRIYGSMVFCSNLGLSNKNEYITLHLPQDGNNERGSKYFPIETEGHDWTSVPMDKEIQIPVVRFDYWAINHQGLINISAYDTLVIDVQGMEMEVLEGFGRYLKAIHYLVVECSAKPVYDGEASAEEVISYLTQKGFKQMTPVEEHDDILFMRKNPYEK